MENQHRSYIKKEKELLQKKRSVTVKIVLFFLQWEIENI